MKRVAVLDDYQNVALSCADWSVLEGRVEIDTFQAPIPEADRVSVLSQYEIIVAMRERTPFMEPLLEQLPKLEMIASIGPINAGVDLDATEKLGIQVSATRGHKPPAMELAWALIMACAKRVHECDQDVKAGLWQTRMGMDLAGARLGLIGLGVFGSWVAGVAKTFDMDIVAWSENLTKERCDEVGVQYASKEELLSTSDIVSIHVRLSERTVGLIAEDAFEQMKTTAYLINTSRGPIVDEEALVAALRDKRIAGAGLDVYDIEPLPVSHPLRALDNVILSPHMGFVTPRTYRAFYGDAVENIAAFLDGKVLRPAEPNPSDPYWWDV
jgi:phosphoglycerate dehydrogenase-like enzyme